MKEYRSIEQKLRHTYEIAYMWRENYGLPLSPMDVANLALQLLKKSHKSAPCTATQIIRAVIRGHRSEAKKHTKEAEKLERSLQVTQKKQNEKKL